MIKRKIWVGTISAALLLGATTVVASGNVTGPNTKSLPAAKNGVQSDQGGYITIEQAKTAALKAADGRVDDVDLEHKAGKVFYEVEIDQKTGEVDVLVDAVTGKVLAVTDMEQDEDDDDREIDTESTKPVPAAEVKLTSEQASAIATKQVSGATVVKVELDTDDGRYVYEVDLKTAQGEADVDIDATTGKVLSVDQDFDDKD